MATTTKQEPLVSKSGRVNYLNLFKKYNNDNREVCKSESLLIDELIPVQRPTKYWLSGSNYTGQWNICGLNGHGIYQFRDGNIFEGTFKDNLFHGRGEYRFDNGNRLKVCNKNGTAYKRMYIYNDGTRYCEHKQDKTCKKTCKPPDRRFAVEIKEGLQPSFNEHMTATQPPIEIGPGQYDCSVGTFITKTNFISKYEDPTQIIRAIGSEELLWVKENCRTAPLPPIGPCPSLYPPHDQWPSPFDWSKTEPEKIEEFEFDTDEEKDKNAKDVKDCDNDNDVSAADSAP